MKSTMKQAPQHKLFAAIAVLIAFVALYSPMRAYASFSDLYDFGGLPDGNNPTGNLVSDPTNPDTLYGITANGGNTGGAYGLGTVYTINLSTGAESVIHAFGSDEAHNPVGGLLLVTPTGGTEVLFGCTSGGPSPGDAPQIFRIKLTGSAPYADTISTLPGIAGNQMIEASNDYVYGTTNNEGPDTAGSLFRIDPTTSTPAASSILRISAPVGPLIQDGTSDSAPVFLCAGGTDEIYELYKEDSGWTSEVYATIAGTDPVGGPVLDGSLYYVPTFAGGSDSEGTISDSDGDTDWSFASDSPGYPPGAPLTVGSDGNLYGTTIGNGVYEQGTLFEFEPGMSPTMVTLNNFESPGTTDGLVPDGAPLEVTDDSGTWLVGVTEIGGTDDNGTVYVGAFP